MAVSEPTFLLSLNVDAIVLTLSFHFGPLTVGRVVSLSAIMLITTNPAGAIYAVTHVRSLRGRARLASHVVPISALPHGRAPSPPTSG